MGRSSRIMLTSTQSLRAAALASLMLLGAATADAATRVNVGLSQSTRLMVAGAAANVVISNPQIADVTVVDTHSVIVQGKGYGSTQVMVFDMAGHMLMDDIVTVTAPQEGQMTLYRGATVHEYNCSPRCEPDSARPSGGQGGN